MSIGRRFLAPRRLLPSSEGRSPGGPFGRLASSLPDAPIVSPKEAQTRLDDSTWRSGITRWSCSTWRWPSCRSPPCSTRSARSQPEPKPGARRQRRPPDRLAANGATSCPRTPSERFRGKGQPHRNGVTSTQAPTLTNTHAAHVTAITLTTATDRWIQGLVAVVSR